ncbi:Bug family tripartite tricarboxylate transporter substrate binding protein [Candidimonas nitroreducens]|nr:tripartite tricarboxylate transporter substrate binding protein [Candidimonas nitroreducens]
MACFLIHGQEARMESKSISKRNQVDAEEAVSPRPLDGARRRFVASGALLALQGAWALAASAQPKREFGGATAPLRIVVPASPGGPIDTLARKIAQRITARSGRAVIVDNRPGAMGVIGVNTVLQFPSDGNTVLMATTGTLVVPTLIVRPAPFNLSDLAPVTGITQSTLVLIANSSVPAKTLPELLALVKKDPSKFAAGNAGKGTNAEMLIAQLADGAGLDILQVPFKGGMPAMQALLSNVVQMTVVEFNQALPLMKAGKIRIIAQFGKRRIQQIPDVPTVSEFMPGVDGSLWIGMLARAGIPVASLQALSGMIRDVMAEEPMRHWVDSIGAQVDTGGPEELAKTIALDKLAFGALVKKYNLYAK